MMNMVCDKCKEIIEDEEKRELHGQVLCEDCYIDALSPVRTCDPWAVHSAKSFPKNGKSAYELGETQTKIIRLLEESGPTEPKAISEKLNIKPQELEREIATLRHMEKVRGNLKDGKKFLCLW